MSTRPDSGPETGWHVGESELRAYAAGRTPFAVATSLEEHLLRCDSCRARVATVVYPAPLEQIWERVAVQVQAPQVPLLERLARRVGLTEQDALLLAGAPSVRGAWLLSVLLCVLFALTAGLDAGRLSLTALLVAPLLPVAAVVLAYGQDSDPLWEHALSAPYPVVRLVVVRVLLVAGSAVPVTALAAVALAERRWFAVAWLVPALACAALTLALSTWVGVTRAAASVTALWSLVAVVIAEPSRAGTAAALVSWPALVSYTAVALVASAVFWLRSDQLSYPGRFP